jgi:hypothetical protein
VILPGACCSWVLRRVPLYVKAGLQAPTCLHGPKPV